MRTLIASIGFFASTLFAACTGVPQPAAHGEPDASDADADGDGDVDTGPEPTMTSIPDWRLTWAVRAGGDEHDEPSSGNPYREGGDAVAPLGDGSVYVAGQAAEAAVFGEGEPNEAHFPDEGVGFSDAFLAKYEPSGALAWMRRIGGDRDDHAFDVIALDDGSAIVVGRFDSSEIVLGEGEPNETVFISDSPLNAYAARYTQTGDLMWAVQIPKSDVIETMIRSRNVSALPNGTLVVAGVFRGTVWPGEATEISSLTGDWSETNWDYFLAWFDPETGAVLRAVRIGGDSQRSENSVGIVENGDVVVASYFSGEEVFGLGETNETTLACSDSMYISCNSLARYDATGRLVWVRDVGAREAGLPMITILESGDIGLHTHFSEPSDIDGDGVFSDTDGLVIAAYSADDGSLVWWKLGTVDQIPSNKLDIFSLPGGGMMLELIFSGTLAFGGDGENLGAVTYAGEADIALVRFSAVGEVEWVHRLGGAGNDIASSGAQLDGTAMWLTGAYGSDPFIATSGNGDDVALPLAAQTDVFLMRFDSTAMPTD